MPEEDNFAIAVASQLLLHLQVLLHLQRSYLLTACPPLQLECNSSNAEM